MGLCESRDEGDQSGAKAVNKQIEKQIIQDERMGKTQVKLLLLGMFCSINYCVGNTAD